MPRAGLTAERVILEAAGLVDRAGDRTLTFAALAAHLGVQPPSLYKHVASLQALERQISLTAKHRLAETLGAAAIGLAREDALLAVASAYRGWATEHRGLYRATMRAPTQGDEEDRAAGQRLIDVLVTIVAGYGLHGDDALYAVRSFWAALHGFVALETAGAFGLALSVDESFERHVRSFVATVSGRSATAEHGDGGR